jgi:hypothetical protein
MSVVEVKSTIAAELLPVKAKTAAAQRVVKTLFMSFSGDEASVEILKKILLPPAR